MYREKKITDASVLVIHIIPVPFISFAHNSIRTVLFRLHRLWWRFLFGCDSLFLSFFLSLYRFGVVYTSDVKFSFLTWIYLEKKNSLYNLCLQLWTLLLTSVSTWFSQFFFLLLLTLFCSSIQFKYLMQIKTYSFSFILNDTLKSHNLTNLSICAYMEKNQMYLILVYDNTST